MGNIYCLFCHLNMKRFLEINNLSLIFPKIARIKTNKAMIKPRSGHSVGVAAARLRVLEVLANIYPVSLYVINFSCKSVHNTLNLIRCL